MEILFTLVSLTYTNNLLMTVVKWLAGASKRTWWLRVVLLVLSVGGLIATSAVTGDPVDFNKISDLSRLTLETAALFFTSHFSYKAIKGA